MQGHRDINNRFEVYILHVSLLIFIRTYNKRILNYFLSLSLIRGTWWSDIFVRKKFLMEVKYRSIHSSFNIYSIVKFIHRNKWKGRSRDALLTSLQLWLKIANSSKVSSFFLATPQPLILQSTACVFLYAFGRLTLKTLN